MNDIELEMELKQVSLKELAEYFKLGINTVRYAIIAKEKTNNAKVLCDKIIAYLKEKPEPQNLIYQEDVIAPDGRGTKRIPIPLPSLVRWIWELKKKK